MSVVTAVRNVRASRISVSLCVVEYHPDIFAQFVRLLGGTLSLAVGGTIMSVTCHTTVNI